MNVMFMGTPDFAVPSLQALITEGYTVGCVVTQPDRPKGRKRTMTPPPVKQAAQELGLPIWQPNKIRLPENVKKLQSLKPDLIVTAAFGQILPRDILETPVHGCINVHASLLPKYRGGAPIHHAIINGEAETGVTLMYMVEALDAGGMLAQRAVPIRPDDTVGSLHDLLSEVGADLLRTTLPQIVDGQITPTPQKTEEVTFAPNIKRDDEQIDWTQPAKAVYNRIRGLNPWPVAFTTWGGEQPCKIWWADMTAAKTDAAPGTVTDVQPDGIVVATGEGEVTIRELQPAGKKRMRTAEFLRGTPVQVGMRLGEHHGQA